MDIGNGVGVGEGEAVGVRVGSAVGVGVAEGTGVADGTGDGEEMRSEAVGSGDGCGVDCPQAVSARTIRIAVTKYLWSGQILIG